MPRAPEVLPAGAHEFRAGSAVSSIYATDSDYHINMNLADTRVGLAVGLGQCWDVELALAERSIVQAHLDQLTFAFHRAFGYSDSGHQQEAGHINVDIPEYGVHLDDGDMGPFSRSAELTLTRLLWARSARAPAAAVSFMARRELLEQRGDAPETDVGVGLSLGQTAGRDRVYGDLTYIWFGANRYLGIPLEAHQLAAALVYEWPRSDDFSWLAQYLYTTGVMQHLGALDEPSHELQLGAKWRYEAVEIEAALIENVIVYNNGPDYGLALGLKIPF
jgi:hypothetical protein